MGPVIKTVIFCENETKYVLKCTWNATLQLTWHNENKSHIHRAFNRLND